MPGFAAHFNALYSALPLFIEWMNRLLDNYRKQAISVADFGFRKIDVVYPPNLRKQAGIVSLKESIPLPPFKKLGLVEFNELEQLNAIGVTYKDLIFLLEDHLTEINCFHEMVHVVQWKHLGVEKFLVAYGMGLIMNGYFENPLEQIAYNYQQKLEANALPMNFLEETRKQTDGIWISLNPLIHLSESQQAQYSK